MRIGVFTALLSKLPLVQVLEKLQSLDIHTVELGTGNYPGDPHCPLSMLTDRTALREFKLKLEDRGFSISSLSCHGNPLHPNAALARAYQETSRKTVRLAEKLGVPVVIDFSGCPGDSNHAKYPNWVTCPWPPEYLEVLDWQWEKKVAPYWTRHAQFAKDHGVKIAIEMHPGFVAYSPETLLKLRSIAGQSVGCNYDPSHMFWQGIDPIEAIRVLGDSIFHVHAKDTQMYAANLPKGGVLDTKSTPTKEIAPGFFGRSDTGMPPAGGKNSFPHCACTATTMCFPSSTRTRSCRPKKGLAKPQDSSTKS